MFYEGKVKSLFIIELYLYKIIWRVKFISVINEIENIYRDFYREKYRKWFLLVF